MKLRLYHAPWSGPCRTFIKGLEDEANGLDLLLVDVDADPGEVGRYGIKAIPTVVAFGEGAGEEIVLGMLVGPANWGKVKAWAKTLHPL
jgi:thioredoxin-like negative regulator of GroEL